MSIDRTKRWTERCVAPYAQFAKYGITEAELQEITGLWVDPEQPEGGALTYVITCKLMWVPWQYVPEPYITHLREAGHNIPDVLPDPSTGPDRYRIYPIGKKKHSK